jgi:nucleosome binding factor SPN SPT16 subunit
MVDYNNIITPEGITRTEITGAEKTQLEADRKAFADKSADRKLIQIKEIRLEKLKETDYMANSDYTMPDNIKTWRQSLRDIPANHTDEAAYDLLLARDASGNLTHSVWSKP